MSWIPDIPFYLCERPNKLMANKVGFQAAKPKSYKWPPNGILNGQFMHLFFRSLIFEVRGLYLRGVCFGAPLHEQPTDSSRAVIPSSQSEFIEMKSCIWTHSTQNGLASQEVPESFHTQFWNVCSKSHHSYLSLTLFVLLSVSTTRIKLELESVRGWYIKSKLFCHSVFLWMNLINRSICNNKMNSRHIYWKILFF